jgi:hypothetical protein
MAEEGALVCCFAEDRSTRPELDIANKTPPDLFPSPRCDLEAARGATAAVPRDHFLALFISRSADMLDSCFWEARE